MLVKEATLKWLQKYLPLIKPDGPKDSSGCLALSAESSLGFQNGVYFFDLFQKLAQESGNKTVTQHLSKIKIIKSQARIAIVSNLTSLAPVFRCYNVGFDEKKRDRIANSGFPSKTLYFFYDLFPILFFRGRRRC